MRGGVYKYGAAPGGPIKRDGGGPAVTNTENSDYYQRLDWIVMCGSNLMRGDHHVIVNGVDLPPSSNSVDGPGQGGTALGIGHTQQSALWQLSRVYIWNYTLSDTDFETALAFLNHELAGTQHSEPSADPTGPDGGECVSCVAGKYKVASGNGICTNCGIGSYSAVVGASDVSTCLACPTNSDSPLASSVSTACLCNAGYFGTGEGGSECRACDAGKFKTNTGNAPCTDCAVGWYSAANRSLCVLCPTGNVMLDLECVSCPDGSGSPYALALTDMDGWEKIKHLPANSASWFSGNTFQGNAISGAHDMGEIAIDTAEWAMPFDADAARFFLFVCHGTTAPQAPDVWAVVEKSALTAWTGPTVIPPDVYKAATGFPAYNANHDLYAEGGITPSIREQFAADKTGKDGWRMVRFLPFNEGKNKYWYTYTDSLTGITTDPPDGPVFTNTDDVTEEWTIPFGDFDEFFISRNEYKDALEGLSDSFSRNAWVWCSKDAVIGLSRDGLPNYGPDLREVKRSSFSPENNYTAEWYNRKDQDSDPMIGTLTYLKEPVYQEGRSYAYTGRPNGMVFVRNSKAAPLGSPPPVTCEVYVKTSRHSGNECVPCNAGYTGPIGGPCIQDCAENTYRLAPEVCQSCPDNSSVASGANTTLTDCVCSSGYSGPDGGPCTACAADTYREYDPAALAPSTQMKCGPSNNLPCAMWGYTWYFGEKSRGGGGGADLTWLRMTDGNPNTYYLMDNNGYAHHIAPWIAIDLETPRNITHLKIKIKSER